MRYLKYIVYTSKRLSLKQIKQFLEGESPTLKAISSVKTKIFETLFWDIYTGLGYFILITYSKVPNNPLPPHPLIFLKKKKSTPPPPNKSSFKNNIENENIQKNLFHSILLNFEYQGKFYTVQIFLERELKIKN